jgi:hypothetical protein
VGLLVGVLVGLLVGLLLLAVLVLVVSLAVADRLWNVYGLWYGYEYAPYSQTPGRIASAPAPKNKGVMPRGERTPAA